jgi:hypothetical protein
MAKKVEAFTFGADLAIQSDPTATRCTFDSPAPLFAVRDPDALASRFVAEAEVVLAEKRAAWDSRSSADDFSRRLASVPPLPLYLACLTAMEEHLKIVPRADRSAHEIQCFIEQERSQHSTAGYWPAQAAALDELLARA